MPIKLPWEVNPALLPQRLQLLARRAVIARNGCADEYRPEKGDDPWCLGCRAYRWTCAEFRALASVAENPWLTMTEEGLRCTIRIGDTPLKFYRGAAEQPNSRSLRSALLETLAMAQTRIKFYDDEMSEEQAGWAWLMAIDTDDEGRALQVVVFEANAEGETRNLWRIPIDEDVAVVSDVSSVLRDGVEQDPAEVDVPETDEKTAEGDDDEGDK
jgi:hypothetical protein